MNECCCFWWCRWLGVFSAGEYGSWWGSEWSWSTEASDNRDVARCDIYADAVGRFEQYCDSSEARHWISMCAYHGWNKG